MTDTLLAAKADSFRFFIETVSQSMQAQQHIAMYGVGVLVVVFSALLAANVLISNRQYKAELGKAVESIRKELIGELESRIHSEVARVEKSIAADLQERMDKADFVMSSLTALASVDIDDAKAVGFLAKAITFCPKTGSQSSLRSSVDALVSIMEGRTWLDSEKKDLVEEQGI